MLVLVFGIVVACLYYYSSFQIESNNSKKIVVAW